MSSSELLLRQQMIPARRKVRQIVGGVISPVLANLFLHYALDCWMRTNCPDIPFERYADDVICHCRSQAQAHRLREALEKRLADCKLQLHPQKTKIVYCKDANRHGNYPEQSFDFLGFTFRPRKAKNRAGKLFVSFTPAVSAKAAKSMRQRIRRWRLHWRSDLDLDDLVRWVQPTLTGWIRYYGRFYPSALSRAIRTIDDYLRRWAQRKYKRLQRRCLGGWDWLAGIKLRQPHLFPHWRLQSMAGQ